MIGPVSSRLSCGQRLHLQHGPIDLIVGCDGDRAAAFSAAQRRFKTVLDELIEELPFLRSQLYAASPFPKGDIALSMDRAARPHANVFLTRMSAVAGAVADTVLKAMLAETRLSRVFVNNGGDIALHLENDQSFYLAMTDLKSHALGQITLTGSDGIGGVATSGWNGRSHSLGIADSVTVLAENAASADVAATLIANEVDLPGHPAVRRKPATELSTDSDLGAKEVTVGCGALSDIDIDTALCRGERVAKHMISNGHMKSAALFLQGRSRLVGHMRVETQSERVLSYA